MKFSESIKTVFGKYVGFSGRARRSEFWWWFLFVSIINFVFSIIWNASIAGAATATSIDAMLAGMFNWAYFLWIIVSLALLLPTLSVVWRRLHDTNRSGGFYFLGLIPFVGAIILLIFFLQDSTPGDNRFGANPKGA